MPTGSPAPEPDLTTAARLEELSGALAEMGRVQDALAYLHRAAATFEGSSELRAAQCYRGCAELALGLGNLDEADRLLASAAAAYAAAGSTDEQAACELRRGEVLRAGGRGKDAQARFEAAWTLHESDDTLLGAAYAALGVASVLHERGEFDAALYVVDRVSGMLAAPAPREDYPPSPPEVEDVYVGQARARADAMAGLILVDTDRFVEAKSSLHRARAWFAEHGETFDAARVDVSIGDIARRQGRGDTALDTLAGARSVFEAAGLPTEAAACAARTALVLLDAGRPGEAIDTLEPALATLRSAGWAVGAARAEMPMGIARRALASPRLAQRHFEGAADVFRAVENPVEAANAESWVAACLTDLGAFAEARAMHGAARARLAGSTAAVARADCLRAYTELAAGDTATARSLAETAAGQMERLGDAVGAASAWIVLARVSARDGQAGEAADWAERAAAAARGAGDVPGEIRARWALAVARMAADDAPAARNGLERVRRQLGARGEVLDRARAGLDLADALDMVGESLDAQAMRAEAMEVLAAAEAASTPGRSPTR